MSETFEEASIQKKAEEEKLDAKFAQWGGRMVEEVISRLKSDKQRWKARLDEKFTRRLPHDKRSEELYRFIAKLDFECGGDALYLKAGGDGDNGELLLAYLDIWFEKQDEINTNIHRWW